MSGRWWRAYDEALHDPKLIALPDKLFRAWFNLLCIASKHGGILPAMTVVAIELRVTIHKAAEWVTALVLAGLFDEIETGKFAPHNWQRRQFQSDVSTDRVKRFRERRGNVSSAVSETPPENRDREQKQSSDPNGSADVVGEDPKARLFRLGKTILVSFGVSEKRTGSLIGQWLKTRNDPVGLLAAIQFARDQNVAEPVAYISTVLRRKEAKNGHGKQDLGELALELADELRERERSAGVQRPPAA